MDLNNLMQMAKQMQERLTSAQDEAAKTRFAGEAGGGLVSVAMSGRHELLEVKIDPKLLRGGDVALLEDLVRAAVNQASVKVAEGLKDHFGGMARDFGVDMDALGFGGNKGSP